MDKTILPESLNASFEEIFMDKYSLNDDKRFKHADDIEETHVSEGEWNK
jgi:hypothetical protein